MKPITAPFEEREQEIIELARSNKLSPKSAVRLYNRLLSETMVRLEIRSRVREMNIGELKYINN